MAMPLETDIFNPTGITFELKLVCFFDNLSSNIGGN